MQNKMSKHSPDPPPPTHTFRISLSRLLAYGSPVNKSQQLSSLSPTGNADENQVEHSPFRGGGNAGIPLFRVREDEDAMAAADQVIEALFPDLSYTIPSPLPTATSAATALAASSSSLGDSFKSGKGETQPLRRVSPHSAASAAGAALPTSSAASAGVDGDDAAARRKSASPTSRRGSAVSLAGSARRRSSSPPPPPLSLSLPGNSLLGWGTEDLEVLRLLLRTINRSSGASEQRRLLPGSGVAARLLLQGCNVAALDAPVHAVRSRITVGNLRQIVSSHINGQLPFHEGGTGRNFHKNVKLNSPRSVVVALRSGVQCDELIDRVAYMLHGTAQLEEEKRRLQPDEYADKMDQLQESNAGTRRILAQLEREYRALCDTVSRGDSVAFLRAPTLPSAAMMGGSYDSYAVEDDGNFVEGTKRRGLMRLSRHQQATERAWVLEQERIAKEKAVEDRLRRRAAALERRKQKAVFDHAYRTLNPRTGESPTGTMKRQPSSCSSSRGGGRHRQQHHSRHRPEFRSSSPSESSSESDQEEDDPTEENAEIRRQRRLQRLVQTRSGSGGRARSMMMPLETANQRVARARAAREALDHQRRLDALEREAQREERLCDMLDRKADLRDAQICRNNAHNQHVAAAVKAQRRMAEFVQARRIARIEQEEAKMMVRATQKEQTRERHKHQLRIARDLDLKTQAVILSGEIELSKRLTAVAVGATSPMQAIKETQDAMLKVAAAETQLERRWNSL